MTKDKNDHAPLKSEDAKGTNTAHSRVDKIAGEAAKNASKTKNKADRSTPIFTK